MELSINGHKVVGGGTVHTVTPIAGSNVTGTITYCVTNGVCIMTFEDVAATNTGNREVGTVPKAKMSVGHSFTRGVGISCYGYVSQDKLFIDVYVANNGAYGSMSYPVADDWHE